MAVNSVTVKEDLVGGGDNQGYLALNGCTNFGGHTFVSIQSGSCSSEATGQSAGMVGLLESEARDAGRRSRTRRCAGSGGRAPTCCPRTRRCRSCARPRTTSTSRRRTRSIPPTTSARRPAASSTRCATRPAPGWDATFGYGRANAYEMVKAVRAGRIPPEADITGPAWFDVLPAHGRREGDRTRRGRRARRSYDYRVEWTTGLQPPAYPGHRRVARRRPSARTCARRVTVTLAQLDLAQIAAVLPDHGRGAPVDPATGQARRRTVQRARARRGHRARRHRRRAAGHLAEAGVRARRPGSARGYPASRRGCVDRAAGVRGPRRPPRRRADRRDRRRRDPRVRLAWSRHPRLAGAHDGRAVVAGEVDARPAPKGSGRRGARSRSARRSSPTSTATGRRKSSSPTPTATSGRGRRNGRRRSGFTPTVVDGKAHSTTHLDFAFSRDSTTHAGPVQPHQARLRRVARGGGPRRRRPHGDRRGRARPSRVRVARRRHAGRRASPCSRSIPAKVAAVDPASHKVTFTPDSGVREGGELFATPTLVDLTGDGRPEIVVGAQEEYAGDAEHRRRRGRARAARRCQRTSATAGCTRSRPTAATRRIPDRSRRASRRPGLPARLAGEARSARARGAADDRRRRRDAGGGRRREPASRASRSSPRPAAGPPYVLDASGHSVYGASRRAATSRPRGPAVSAGEGRGALRARSATATTSSCRCPAFSGFSRRASSTATQRSRSSRRRRSGFTRLLDIQASDLQLPNDDQLMRLAGQHRQRAARVPAGDARTWRSSSRLRSPTSTATVSTR